MTYSAFHRPNVLFAWVVMAAALNAVMGRPLVRHIRSTHEFERLLQKHATTTGLPVIVDFYSDGCGPCRMMAPVFKNLAKQTGQENAVFVKVDTNAVHELSSRYAIRSLPTFLFFLNGKKVNEFSGAGEAQLRSLTKEVVNKSQKENVFLEKQTLIDFYAKADPSKDVQSVDVVYQKCVDMVKDKNVKDCVGSAATQLARRLKDKYKTGPTLVERFNAKDRSPDEKREEIPKNTRDEGKAKRSSAVPNLHLATKEQLQEELEKRIDAEVDAMVEEEEDDDAEFQHGWTGPGDFPERVTIIGGGPAGIAAAIYAARAGLNPVVVAPPMGGQLQGKGVDVENYPGLTNVTGPAVISAMRAQAAAYGAVFEAELVTKIDATSRPFKIYTTSNSTLPSSNNVIETHAIIVATGAESNWLNVPGEYELRGGGVSSCATCDGAFFYGKNVVVVGGGDAAMEDALLLARTSKHVTVLHRRDSFRASKVLAQRVLDHVSISVIWNSLVQKIVGEALHDASSESDDEVDLDRPSKQVVTGVIVQNVLTNDLSKIPCDAVFVAIGHTPTTSFLKGIVEFDEAHPGYVKTIGTSTKTSVPGIFAAGDVSDAVYRQAITSAGSGAAAALDAERWLSEEGLGNEAAEFEAELLAEFLEEEDNKNTLRRGEYNVYEDMGGRVEGMKESISRVEL